MSTENSEPGPEWRIAMDLHADGGWRYWATGWREIVVTDPARNPVAGIAELMKRLLAEADMTEEDQVEARKVLESSLECLVRAEGEDLPDENSVGFVPSGKPGSTLCETRGMRRDGDDWTTAAAHADALGVEAGSFEHVVARALESGVSGEVVLEGYRRSFAFWAENPEDPGFDQAEALPPGLLDLRVLDQDAIWIDVLRRERRIDHLTDEHLGNVIGWLQHFADSLAQGYARMHEALPSSDPEAWLEQTVLLRALRAEAAARGITHRVPAPKPT